CPGDPYFCATTRILSRACRLRPRPGTTQLQGTQRVTHDTFGRPSSSAPPRPSHARLELPVEKRDGLVLPDPEPKVPPAQPARRPPVDSTRKAHERGHERGADEERVDHDGDPEADAEGLHERDLR